MSGFDWVDYILGVIGGILLVYLYLKIFRGKKKVGNVRSRVDVDALNQKIDVEIQGPLSEGLDHMAQLVRLLRPFSRIEARKKILAKCQWIVDSNPEYADQINKILSDYDMGRISEATVLENLADILKDIRQISPSLHRQEQNSQRL